jgi:hypothetical protein
VKVHLDFVIYGRQARLNPVSKVKHTIFIDQSDHRTTVCSIDHIPAAPRADPTSEMAIDHYDIEQVAIQGGQSCY